MLTSRIRAAMLGTLAVMLLGSAMAASASAEAGPFWHHRAAGEEGVGAKIESKAPENFKGTGGPQTLVGKIGGETVEISSSSLQVKGAIYNSAFQGQVKLELIYNQPTLVKPALKPCTVTVGTNNIAPVKGHLMWKWDGTEAQLNEVSQANQVPELVFTPIEIQTGDSEIRKGGFTNVALKGTACGVLAGTFPVSGSEVGYMTPSKVETWSKKLAVRTVAGENFLQHFWNGTRFVGAKVNLLFNSLAATLVGQTEVEAEQQEVAVFEK